MKRNLKKFTLLLLHFFFFCYLVYSSKDIKNEGYIKILSFLSLETLTISIFFLFKKGKIFSSTKKFFYILSFFIVIFLNYLGIDYLAFSIIIIISIELPIILYLFILFLVKEKFVYFIYTMLNLFLFTISLILIALDFKWEFLGLLILKNFIIFSIYSTVYFLVIILLKNKKRIMMTGSLLKKNVKNNILMIFHLLFIILLTYNSEKIEAPYYKEVTLFISFELFGIILFYSMEIYIEHLYKKIIFSLLFYFLIIKIFEYLDKEIIDFLFLFTGLEILLLILALFIYSIVKKSIAHLGYALIELVWYIIFIFFNAASSIPELGSLELHTLHIFSAYIVVSLLYASLFQKNERKKLKDTDDFIKIMKGIKDNEFKK